jgi:hypothetical protein
MLAEILEAFRETGGPLDLEELSRRLGTDRSALEGMLELLVRQGKLKEVSLGSTQCDHCSGRKSCAMLKKGNLLGTVYELAEKSGQRR